MATCPHCNGCGEVADDEDVKLSESEMLSECLKAGKRVYRGHVVRVDVASFLTGLAPGTLRNKMSGGELTPIRLTANSVGVSIRELAKLGKKN